MNKNKNHFLVICLPFQSHMNPTLRLADKLTRLGARVTFVTTINGLSNLKNRPSHPGLSYDSFSDRNDEGGPFDKPNYYEQMKLVGSISLKNLIATKSKNDQKVSFIIYGMCLPWVAQTARDLHVPSAFFFFQSGASLRVMYHLLKINDNIDPSAEKSVIYVSFGSFVELDQKQKEEMFQGLIESGHPFLWVIRASLKPCCDWLFCDTLWMELDNGECGKWHTDGGISKIRRSNIKRKNGRASVGERVKAVADNGGVVTRDEIKRCLNVVMGDGEIKSKCEILKGLAQEANVEGASLKPCCDWLFCDTLRMELDNGECGKWHTDGGVSKIRRSNIKRKNGRGSVGERGEGHSGQWWRGDEGRDKEVFECGDG
nr:crocetin glucosyltransferase, chloroplastic-like [Tanacetum cinerariifolium]